jgi:hypothetical protein
MSIGQYRSTSPFGWNLKDFQNVVLLTFVHEPFCAGGKKRTDLQYLASDEIGLPSHSHS